MSNETNYSKISKAFLSLPIFTATKQDYFKVNLDNYYGYKDIKIAGLQLTPDLDFRLFAQLLRVAKKQNLRTVCISYPELKRLGFSCDSKSRKALENSLFKLASVTIGLRSLSGERFKAFNMLKGEVTPENNLQVTFSQDFMKLFDSEKFIYNLYIPELVKLKSLSAKALFLHLQSNQSFIDFTHEQLVIRLGLIDKAPKNQNRAIKTGLTELEKVGYLSRWKTKKQGCSVVGYKIYQVDSKKRKLLLDDIEHIETMVPDKANMNEPISEETQAIVDQFDEFDFEELDEPVKAIVSRPRIDEEEEFIDVDYSYLDKVDDEEEEE